MLKAKPLTADAGFNGETEVDWVKAQAPAPGDDANAQVNLEIQSFSVLRLGFAPAALRFFHSVG